MPRCKSDNQIAKTRRPAILRSVSLGAIDTSHIEGIRPRQRQEGLGEGDGQEQGEEQEELEGSRRALQQEQQQQQQGIVGPRDAELPDSPQKPVSPTGDDSGHSAEEIALRRFMTVVAWGPGMTVLKHNRRKGRARRVLKFNDQVRPSNIFRLVFFFSPAWGSQPCFVFCVQTVSNFSTAFHPKSPHDRHDGVINKKRF